KTAMNDSQKNLHINQGFIFQLGWLQKVRTAAHKNTASTIDLNETGATRFLLKGVLKIEIHVHSISGLLSIFKTRITSMYRYGKYQVAAKINKIIQLQSKTNVTQVCLCTFPSLL